MSPGGVRVGDLVLVEDVLVVVEDERALILRHPVLASATVEESLVLSWVPVGHDCLVQIRLHVLGDIQHVAVLCPGREEPTASLEDVGSIAGLHVKRHLVREVLWVGRVEDAEVRMLGPEHSQFSLSHGGEPLRAPILVDELHPALAGSDLGGLIASAPGKDQAGCQNSAGKRNDAR